MLFKIVFSDIDGTLLNSQHELLPSTLKAIHRLREKNILFVPISARMPKAIVPILKELAVKAPIISYNGALILSAENEQLFSQKPAEKNCLSILKDIRTQWPQIVINYYCADDWYVEDLSDRLVKEEAAITGVTPLEASFQALLSSGKLPHKLLCMCPPSICQQMENILTPCYPAFNIIRSSPTLLEIIDKSVSKAHAVKKFMELYNIPASQAIAFGDNYNDLDMLSTVGMGIAMGNAPLKVKTAAAQITSSNDADGIYNALRAINLL